MLSFHDLLDKAEAFVLSDVQAVESVLVIQPNAFRYLHTRPIKLWRAHRLDSVCRSERGRLYNRVASKSIQRKEAWGRGLPDESSEATREGG